MIVFAMAKGRFRINAIVKEREKVVVRREQSMAMATAKEAVKKTSRAG